MKNQILIFTSFFLISNLFAFEKETTALIEAQIITKNFAMALKKELKKAIKTGGPIKALTVCNAKAIPITTRSAQISNANISRISLKNRNPQNTPNLWQKKVLEDFDQRVAKGEDISKMAFYKTIETDNKKQFYFIKAVPTKGVCLMCHGQNIAPNIQAKITELYPNDKAIGYKKGQVRGAIVVIKNLK